MGRAMPSILVIDDKPIIRQPLAALLEQAGYRTQTAAGTTEARAVLDAGPVALVLMELVLPGTSGLELIKHIRSNAATAALPVVVLTSSTEKESLLHAVEAGVSGYLIKEQFDQQRLLRTIAAALSRSALGQPHTLKLPTRAAESGPESAPSVPESSPAAPAPSRSAAPRADASTPRTGGAPVAVTLTPDATQAERLQSLRPLAERAEIQKKLDSFGEMRAISPALAQVVKLTRSPGASVDALVRAIRTDHAIALKIIRLANSSVYARGNPVDSVKTAVVRIGTEQIRQTVLNIAVVERFSSIRFDEYLNYAQFWEHAIATGIIAAALTRARDPAACDAAFTMGLLHDVGRMIMAEQLGDHYLAVLRASREHALPLEQVEKRMLLMTHADIMDRVLRQWQFPIELIDPIAFHQLSAGNIRSAAPKRFTEIATLSLANRLAHALLLGGSGNRAIAPTEELCEALKIDAGLIAKVEESAPAEADDIKYAMLANSDASGWMPARDEARARLASPARVAYVGLQPGIDSFRMVCDRLSDATLEQPTLAVVHLRSARDRAELTRALLAADREAHAKLPALLISPNGQLRLEEPVMATRPTAFLPEPFTIDRLIDSINGVTAAGEPATAQAA